MEECSNCLAKDTQLIDVIQSWRIVRMCESCAREEGATILNPKQLQESKPSYLDLSKKSSAKTAITKEMALYDLRRQRPASPIIQDLIENFNWHLSQARRQKNLTRKRLAERIQCSENDIKLLENGILPKDDYVLINKLENTLQLKLRKDASSLSSPKPTYSSSMQKRKDAETKKDSQILGDEIEVIE